MYESKVTPCAAKLRKLLHCGGVFHNSFVELLILEIDICEREIEDSAGRWRPKFLDRCCRFTHLFNLKQLQNFDHLLLLGIRKFGLNVGFGRVALRESALKIFGSKNSELTRRNDDRVDRCRIDLRQPRKILLFLLPL